MTEDISELKAFCRNKGVAWIDHIIARIENVCYPLNEEQKQKLTLTYAGIMRKAISAERGLG